MLNLKLHKIKDQQGLTLMELVVSLALVGILATVLVSGNIFVQKVLAGWSTNNRLCEEGEWLLSNLSDLIEGCDSLRYEEGKSSWNFYFRSHIMVCKLENGLLRKDGLIMHHRDFNVKKASVFRIPFTRQANDSILPMGSLPVNHGLYDIEIELTYRRKLDVFHKVTRNIKEYIRQKK